MTKYVAELMLATAAAKLAILAALAVVRILQRREYHAASEPAAIAEVQPDAESLLRNIPALVVATVLPFFIAGLLYLLRFERVDNLGAYTASRPETGLLISSGYNTIGII